MANPSWILQCVDHGLDRSGWERSFDGLGIAVCINKEGSWGAGYACSSALLGIFLHFGEHAVGCAAVFELGHVEAKVSCGLFVEVFTEGVLVCEESIMELPELTLLSSTFCSLSGWHGLWVEGKGEVAIDEANIVVICKDLINRWGK